MKCGNYEGKYDEAETRENIGDLSLLLHVVFLDVRRPPGFSVDFAPPPSCRIRGRQFDPKMRRKKKRGLLCEQVDRAIGYEVHKAKTAGKSVD